MFCRRFAVGKFIKRGLTMNNNKKTSNKAAKTTTTATTTETVQQPEKSKQQIAYEKQLAALLAVGFSQADAEKALAAIKPVARVAAEEMPEERWQLAKGLSAWMLTPDSDNNTEKVSPFIISDVPADIAFAQVQADVETFLNKSTFANATKKGKQVQIGTAVYNRADASKHAASVVVEAFKKLINSIKAGA